MKLAMKLLAHAGMVAAACAIIAAIGLSTETDHTATSSNPLKVNKAQFDRIHAAASGDMYASGK